MTGAKAWGLSVLSGAVLAAGLVGCGPRTPPTVSMRVTGGPDNATVTVDDQFVGSLAVVAARGVALPVGVHHVTVEAAGFLPWDKTVEAKQGEGPVRLDVKLVPIPD
ncbi:PEGA domain-containing protein [Labilithrix luteola]|nr:PEGA domain-containing protein [Labilithrix luteola]